jgi:hypothetical protein
MGNINSLYRNYLEKKQIKKFLENVPFSIELYDSIGSCSNYREVVLVSVRKYGYLLSFVSDQFKEDKEIVFAAINQDGWALKYASNKMQNDIEVVLVAVKKDLFLLKFASEDLRHDHNFKILANIFALMGEFERSELKSISEIENTINDAEICKDDNKENSGKIIKYFQQNINSILDKIKNGYSIEYSYLLKMTENSSNINVKRNIKGTDFTKNIILSDDVSIFI